jgi:hypothetical protein
MVVRRRNEHDDYGNVGPRRQIARQRKSPVETGPVMLDPLIPSFVSGPAELTSVGPRLPSGH